MQIEHDPNETREYERARGRQFTFATIAPLAAVLSLWYHPISGMDWRDYSALTFFYFFTLWAVGPRKTSNAQTQQSASEQIAFRFGKFLNRVFRRGR